MARRQGIAQQKMTIRDLSSSREKWRAEALSSRGNAKADAEKIRKLETAVETLECRVAATDSKKKAKTG